MRNRLTALVFVSCFLSLSIAEVRAAGLEELQGTWRQTSGEAVGGDMPDNGYTISISGNKYIEREVRRQNSKLSLDASSSPMKINFTSLDGPTKGRIFPGIFKLSGSHLVECTSMSGKEPPRSFEPLPDEFVPISTWNRIGPVPPGNLPIERQIEGDWELISMVVRGKEAPAYRTKGVRLNISVGEWHAVTNWERHGEIVVENNSRNLDFTETESNRTYPGIFEFMDKDSVRICRSLGSEIRPSGFTTKPAFGRFMRELKRVEKP